MRRLWIVSLLCATLAGAAPVQVTFDQEAGCAGLMGWNLYRMPIGGTFGSEIWAAYIANQPPLVCGLGSTALADVTLPGQFFLRAVNAASQQSVPSNVVTVGGTTTTTTTSTTTTTLVILLPAPSRLTISPL